MAYCDVTWLGEKVARPAPQVASRRQMRVSAKYDNAMANDENARSWWTSDYLSAKSANSFQIRRTLRIRSRNEVSNNPYLFGIANSNADDLINTGPTLQCKRSSQKENRQIELAWQEWCEEVELVEKLRTVKLAKTIDGEGFLVLKSVSELEQVQLYPVDIEADQVTTPAPKDMRELWVDGLVLHPVTGRPTAYTILKSHPGDYFFPNLNPLEVEKVKAKHVVHWFPKFRPGQVRGVPVFTPSLDLFSDLRSFRRAVLTKMRTSANLTSVLETEAGSDIDDTDTPTPFEHIPIDAGTHTTLPGGAKMHQYDVGEAGTTYEMFQEKCLGEACRPLAYPLNLALGTSQKFNFSSARLDHINYRNSLDVERAECDRVVLNRIFAAWLDEAIMIPGLLPKGINTVADVPHDWHWPGYAPLDPVQDAVADHARIANGTMTWQQFWASRGMDWLDIMAQQAAERDEMERLELVFGEPLKQTKTESIADPNAELSPELRTVPTVEADVDLTSVHSRLDRLADNIAATNRPPAAPQPVALTIHSGDAKQFAGIAENIASKIVSAMPDTAKIISALPAPVFQVPQAAAPTIVNQVSPTPVTIKNSTPAATVKVIQQPATVPPPVKASKRTVTLTDDEGKVTMATIE